MLMKLDWLSLILYNCRTGGTAGACRGTDPQRGQPAVVLEAVPWQRTTRQREDDPAAGARISRHGSVIYGNIEYGSFLS